MAIQKIILVLFYKSSNWLLKLSFYLLPIALFFSMVSFLFVDNLLNSYNRYIENSYMGVQGRLSIISNDTKFISGLIDFSQKSGFLYSPKREIKSNFTLKNGDKIVSKFANFIVLNKNYLEKKFHQKIEVNTLFVNRVFSKSMGSLGLDGFKEIYIKKDNSLNISKIVVVDTGFLGNKPMIFVTNSFAKKLFKREIVFNSVEFLEKNIESISQIKDKAKSLAKEYGVFKYKIKDILNDTKDVKKMFDTLFNVKAGISCLIFVLSLFIILLGISVSIEFRKNSLSTLHLIGMSVADLAITLSGIMFIIWSIILGVSLLALYFVRMLFISIAGFGGDFFLGIGNFNVIMIVILGVMLSLIVYWGTYIMFKGQK